MKTLFSSPKKLLKYTLTLTGLIVLLGAVLFAFFGFNLSANLGERYEINVDIIDETKISSSVDTINNCLSEFDYKGEELSLQDRDYCTTIVMKYKSNSTSNASIIKDKLVERLGVSEEVVSINLLKNSYNKTLAIKLIIPAIILAVILFIYGLFRQDWLYGINTTLSFCLPILLSLSIFAFTRIRVSLSSLYLLFVYSILSEVLAVYFNRKMQTIKNDDLKNFSYSDSFVKVFDETKWLIYVLAVGAIIAPFILTMTFKVEIMGFAPIVALICSLLSSLIIVPSIIVAIGDSKQEKLQQSLSRNKNGKSFNKEKVEK